MTKRGRILRDTNVGSGLVTVDAKQYSFTLEDMWVSEAPPRPGMVVDVTFDLGNIPVSLRAVPETELAREQAQLALAEARRHGTALTGGVRSQFGIRLVFAEGVLLLSFFFLPAMRVGSGYMNRILTGWEAVGLDPATASTNNHGILALSALALFAPIAVPFLHRHWSHWLYAAPFAFTLIAFGSIWYEIENTARTARQTVNDTLGTSLGSQLGDPTEGMFSPGIGVVVMLLCSLYLLYRAFRADPGIFPSA